MGQSYNIPTEIKSEFAMGLGIFLKDMIMIGLFYLIMSFFDNFIFPGLVVPYTIFNILLAVILTRKTSDNPGKKVYHKIFFSLMKRKNTKYRGLDIKARKIEYMED